MCADNVLLSSAQQAELVQLASNCLAQRYGQLGERFTSPDDLATFLKLQFADYAHEVFGIVFLTNKYQMIAFEPLFFGTINGCSVYPRVVLERVLAHNAAAVVLAHNHPSGDVTPSPADKRITADLYQLLARIDVKLLDHVVVGGDRSYAMARACAWPFIHEFD